MATVENQGDVRGLPRQAREPFLDLGVADVEWVGLHGEYLVMAPAVVRHNGLVEAARLIAFRRHLRAVAAEMKADYVTFRAFLHESFHRLPNRLFGCLLVQQNLYVRRRKIKRLFQQPSHPEHVVNAPSEL